MHIIKDVAVELFGMFVADARLTAAVLGLVLGVAALLHVAGVAPLLGGIVLLVGCMLVLGEAVLREARRRRT